jgi:hypothetical protein
MPSSFVFQRTLIEGRISCPEILTGNQDAAPSPLSLPTLWLVLLSCRYTRASLGNATSSVRSKDIKVRDYRLARRTRQYLLANSSPSPLGPNNGLYCVFCVLCEPQNMGQRRHSDRCQSGPRGFRRDLTTKVLLPNTSSINARRDEDFRRPSARKLTPI